MPGAVVRDLLRGALELSEEQRLELASELIASVDGPVDGDWDQAWLVELDRRVERTERDGDRGHDWAETRTRVLERLSRR